MGTTTYTYDGLNRLKKEQAPDKTYNYTYDYYGNRSQLSVSGGESYTASYVYDKNNRLTKQTKTLGKVSDITEYWYDPNGNQISSMTITSGETPTNRAIGIEPAGGDSNSINEYDSWNQLTKTMQNGKTASYTYNGDGLRMSKTVDGTTTNHIWDGTNIAGDVTNGTITKYIRGLQLISSKKGSSESFYNFNGHGDVVQLTNGSGSITKQYSYDAFGVEQNKADNDTNPFRYCGEYFDNETDSIYLRARYYRPSMGRFINEDSHWNVHNMIYDNKLYKEHYNGIPDIDSIRQSSNLYLYCMNNTVMYTDPNGDDTAYVPNLDFQSIGVYENIEEKQTGLYVPLASIVNNSGKYVSWTASGKGGTAKVIFVSDGETYRINIKFDSMERNTYGSVKVYKNNKLVGAGDRVVDMLNSQQAYFYLEESENTGNMIVMAKASTMFWLFENNTTYQYVQATYDFVQQFASVYNIDKQTIYNYLKDQPIINISYDYYAPSYMDAFAKSLGI